jgi:hypothetical protein
MCAGHLAVVTKLLLTISNFFGRAGTFSIPI